MIYYYIVGIGFVGILSIFCLKLYTRRLSDEELYALFNEL